MSVLALEAVASGYGATPVLRGVDFNIEAGSVVALLGRNGMGKTTCMSTIAGVVPVTSGKISFNGADITSESAIQRSRRGIGLVPETRQVFASCTVREHLTMAARNGPRGEGRWTLDRLFETFRVLGDRSAALGTQLSGGEQQMLAIARALSSNPDLLLLDEPSEGLAPSVVLEIAEVLRELVRSNEHGAIVLVEQNVELALSVATRVLVMSTGQIVFDGSRDEFVEARDVQEKYIGVG
ncbi:MAG: ABC transporter ATP-binding protein [Intrasporangium sp.]|uniref:ABC transporter ATP-binding protein n=1 Tax=Intrasporangium sp. TaxID=1925024 RepID=UPI0026470522|nr:ABC transporter ATP-binding protein [Intrasporangium sp.]MDN5794131.1 ABC transporter ATP-binding protein [Intrasporangium sp.]